MKIKPLEWEKIIANEATDRGLISKTHKAIHEAKYCKQTTQ